MRGALVIIQPTMPVPAPQAAAGALWHIVRSQVQGERKAFRWLSYRFFHTYLPVERRVVRLGRGHKRVAWKPLLPGYVFVCLPDGFDEWEQIRRMPGVADFMMMSGRMATLDEQGIEVIRLIEEMVNAKKKKFRFDVGNIVKLNEKAVLEGFDARVKRLSKNDRAIVTLLASGIDVEIAVDMADLVS